MEIQLKCCLIEKVTSDTAHHASSISNVYNSSDHCPVLETSLKPTRAMVSPTAQICYIFRKNFPATQLTKECLAKKLNHRPNGHAHLKCNWQKHMKCGTKRLSG